MSYTKSQTNPKEKSANPKTEILKETGKFFTFKVGGLTIKERTKNVPKDPDEREKWMQRQREKALVQLNDGKYTGDEKISINF